MPSATKDKYPQDWITLRVQEIGPCVCNQVTYADNLADAVNQLLILSDYKNVIKYSKKCALKESKTDNRASHDQVRQMENREEVICRLQLV